MTKQEKTFYLHKGKTIKNLKALAKELKDMSHDVYDHHVSPMKNDFASWIEHSLKEEKLARSLEKKVDRLEVEVEILRHLLDEKTSKTKKQKTNKKTSSSVKKTKK